jgi:hypothetical protein
MAKSLRLTAGHKTARHQALRQATHSTTSAMDANRTLPVLVRTIAALAASNNTLL